MNSVQLHGRIANDIELKTNSNGTEYCNFSIAVDRYMGKDKDKQTDFIPCKAYSKTAAFLHTYFGKGKEIAASGTLHVDKYEKDGTMQSYIYVLMERVEFCGSAKKENNSGNQRSQANQSPAEEAGFVPMETPDPDDLPF